MNTNSSLNTSLFNFAFTGVMPPHKRAEEERTKSQLTRFVPWRKNPQG